MRCDDYGVICFHYRFLTMLLQLIFGLGTPLQLDRESIIVGVFTKILYNLPTNATDFTEPGVYYTRASKSRWSFYKMFEKMMALYGFGGKECLLRAICEVAYVPFDIHHGLLGQLVQAFLRQVNNVLFLKKIFIYFNIYFESCKFLFTKINYKKRN